MTTAQLLQKIDAEGLEWVLDRYENEPEDSPGLQYCFEVLQSTHEEFKRQAARFDSAIRAAAGKEG